MAVTASSVSSERGVSDDRDVRLYLSGLFLGTLAIQIKSATELNKELNNPLATLWSITFQENTYSLNMPTARSDRNFVNVH